MLSDASGDELHFDRITELEALSGATADEAVFVDDNAEFVAGAEAVGIASLRIDRDADRPGGGVITSLTALLA